jgi:hypothetical protein
LQTNETSPARAGEWSQLWLIALGTDLLENAHHVKLDPFFCDLSSFDEGDVYVSDRNSLSSCRDALILSSVSAIHGYASHDLVAFCDMVFQTAWMLEKAEKNTISSRFLSSKS